jgi:hypothetical protein
MSVVFTRFVGATVGVGVGDTAGVIAKFTDVSAYELKYELVPANVA